MGTKWAPPLGVVNEKKKERIRIKQRRKEMMTNKVIQFLKREDNSTMMAGKKDCTSGKDKEQKRVLSDYLHNLHKKFQLENSEIKILRSQFAKMRPRYNGKFLQ